MKEVQHGESIYLNEYTEYDIESWADLVEGIDKKMEQAAASGLKNVFVQFRSTLEPYEDCSTGPVEVQIRGQRELTVYEQAQQAEQTRIEKLAKDLGVSFYEASTVDRLKRAGKI